jgi:hypothetical protein
MSKQCVQADKAVAAIDTTALKVKLSPAGHGRTKGCWSAVAAAAAAVACTPPRVRRTGAPRRQRAGVG